MPSLPSRMSMRPLGAMKGYTPMAEAKSPSPPPPIKWGNLKNPSFKFAKKS
jgi:hypothetical protein